MTRKHIRKEALDILKEQGITYCEDPECHDYGWMGHTKHLLGDNCPEYNKVLNRLFQEYAEKYNESVKKLPVLPIPRGLHYHGEERRVSMHQETFERICSFFDKTTYGVRKADGEVYELCMPYTQARDIAEVAGLQLLQKIESDWMEA